MKLFNFATTAVILGLVFIALIATRTISTPEIWTHLAQGKTNAPLSYLNTQDSTASYAKNTTGIYDTSVNTTHLYDKITYSLWNMGGATALILTNILLLLATFILLIRTSMKWGGALSQGFALLLCGHLLFKNIDVGPQTVAMLFTALFIYLYSTIKKPALLFAIIIPLQILWANLHPSFVLGAIITIFFAIDTWKTAKVKTRNHLPKTSSNKIWILALLLFIVPLLNPSFHHLYKQLFLNLEHQAPFYTSTLLHHFYLIPNSKPLIFFTLVLGAAGLVSYKKTLPFFITALAIFGVIIVWGMPQISYLFVALSFPFIVLSFSTVGTSLAKSIKSFIKTPDKIFLPTSLALFLLLFLLSIFPILTNAAYRNIASTSSVGFGMEEALYPNDLDALFSDPSFPNKIINTPFNGGYIAFHYNKNIFVDFRSGRYPIDLLIDLEKMLTGDHAASNKIIEKYRPEALIINTIEFPSSQGITQLLNTKIWKLVYFDGSTVVLLQNNKKFDSLLNNKKLQQAGIDKINQDLKSLNQKVESGKQTELYPRLIGAANVYLAFNRPKQSEELFKRLLQSDPSLLVAQIGLGKSQYFLKNFKGALKNLEHATQKDPNNLVVWIFYADTCAKLNLPKKLKIAEGEISRIRKLQKEKEKAEEKENDEKTNNVASTL